MTGGLARRIRSAERLYTCAMLGAYIGFMPLLVLLLPRRIQSWGAEQSLETLSGLLLLGAVTASLAHMVAGNWSDRWMARSGSRRGLIALGTALLCAAYIGLGLARTVPQLAVWLVAFQISLNFMFAPLGALLADYIPDPRKGRVAGMLNAAQPASYGVIALFAWYFPTDHDGAFYCVAGLIAVLVLPLVVIWPFPDGLAIAAAPTTPAPTAETGLKRDFILAWLSRLFVQLGAAVIAGYLFLYIVSRQGALGPAPGANVSTFVGDLALLALVASFSVALAGGLLSDRLAQRLRPLAGFALLSAAALVGMVVAPGWVMLAASYALFNIGLAGFQAVDAAMIAQLLSHNPRRGAFLGIMNLTNTIPAIVVPALALLTVSEGSITRVFGPMLIGSAIAAMLAAILVLQIRRLR